METAVRDIHQELVKACGQGDQKAQFEIYKLYYKSMYNTSLRILNHTAEAEDIMQDSFLDAFRQMDQFSGRSSFGAWLKRIVVNNSLDALRKNSRLSYVEEYDQEIPDEKEDKYDDITYKIDEVKKAIQQLPDEYRVVLTLYLLEGYDHDEISDILNISNITSRVRYHRARIKLRELLEESRIRNLIY